MPASTFKQPDGPAKPLGPGETIVEIGGGRVNVPTDVVPRKRGSLKLTLLEPLAPSEYAHLQQALDKSDVMETYGIRSRDPGLDNNGMNFRYPPIPPAGGFNVFGLLSQLALHVKSGQVMIGASSVSIPAPTVVEFNDIMAFTPRRNVVPIPLVVNGQQQSLDFSVESTSKLWLRAVAGG